MSENDRAERRSSTTTYTYHDPGRTFDGSPYEASGKAVAQLGALVKFMGTRVLADIAVQVRNAFMQRNIDLTGDPNAEGWEDSPEFKTIQSMKELIETLVRKGNALHRAASYDPAHPPKD